MARHGKTRRKRDLLKPQCHPALLTSKGSAEEGCIPESILTDVAKSIGIGSGNLLEKVSGHFGVNPKDQYTLLNILPIPDDLKKDLIQNNLRPIQPLNWKNDPDQWLDSNNIRDVMKQYEVSHKNFKFFGPYPIDFASKDPYTKDKKKCLISEMCDLDIDGKDLEGKEYLGFVFNLDPHNKGGSHWVAGFLNIPKKEFYYFDSYGMRPPKQIYRFMQWLTLQEPDMKLKMNGIEMQKKDSECGMYCIYFIICMLDGENFRHFCKRAPSDEFMLEMRNRVFST